MFMLFEKPVLHYRCGDTDYQACIFTCLCVFICIRIVRFVNQEAIVSLSNDTSWKDYCHISFYNPDYITNIIPAVDMFIILVTSSPISSSIFISFVFYQKVTHYGQLWLLLSINCHYNTRACVYPETLFKTLYDNG